MTDIPAVALHDAPDNPHIAPGFTGELHVTLFADQTPVHTTQTYDAGRRTGWVEASEPAPWSLEVSGAAHTWCDPATAHTARLRVGARCTPLVPFDITPAVFDQLPVFEHATLSVHAILSNSPFGQVWNTTVFDNGRVVVSRSGVGDPDGDATVAASMSWEGYTRWRAGADILEVIAFTGDVTGHWTELLCLHGLVQTPEWEAAQATFLELPQELLAAFGGAS